MAEVATKKCPQCQEEIPTGAKKCPKCQSDIRIWFARHKILTGILGIILFMALVATAGSGDSGTENAKEQEAPQPKQEEIVEVETTSFIREFDENQLAAEKKYEGKIVKFTGYIDNISEDIIGTPFLSIGPTTEEFYVGTSIKCSFWKDEDDLTSLKNGERVTLQGGFRSQTFGVIMIRDCKLIK